MRYWNLRRAYGSSSGSRSSEQRNRLTRRMISKRFQHGRDWSGAMVVAGELPGLVPARQQKQQNRLAEEEATAPIAAELRRVPESVLGEACEFSLVLESAGKGLVAKRRAVQTYEPRERVPESQRRAGYSAARFCVRMATRL